MKRIVGIRDWPGLNWITPIDTTTVAWLLSAWSGHLEIAPLPIERQRRARRVRRSEHAGAAPRLSRRRPLLNGGDRLEDDCPFTWRSGALAGHGCARGLAARVPSTVECFVPTSARPLKEREVKPGETTFDSDDGDSRYRGIGTAPRNCGVTRRAFARAQVVAHRSRSKVLGRDSIPVEGFASTRLKHACPALKPTVRLDQIGRSPHLARPADSVAPVVARRTPVAVKRALDRRLPSRIEGQSAGASDLEGLAQCLQRFGPDPAPEAWAREVNATLDGPAHHSNPNSISSKPPSR